MGNVAVNHGKLRALAAALLLDENGISGDCYGHLMDVLPQADIDRLDELVDAQDDCFFVDPDDDAVAELLRDWLPGVTVDGSGAVGDYLDDLDAEEDL